MSTTNRDNDPTPMWGKAPRGPHKGRHAYEKACDDRECYWWPRSAAELERSGSGNADA